jgi:hypothetical protein
VLSDKNSNVIILGLSSDYRQMFTNKKSYTVSQKLKVMAYADHHSMTAAAMNFSMSKPMVSYWKVSRDVVEKALLKARKLGIAPKPHFSREERCLFERFAIKDRMDIRWSASRFKARYASLSANDTTHLLAICMGFCVDTIFHRQCVLQQSVKSILAYNITVSRRSVLPIHM